MLSIVGISAIALGTVGLGVIGIDDGIVKGPSLRAHLHLVRYFTMLSVRRVSFPPSLTYTTEKVGIM